jgi:hypothetical protein
MAPIVSSIEITRPPAEVFAYVADPARFASKGQVHRAWARGSPQLAGSVVPSGR